MAYTAIDDSTLYFSSTIWTGNGSDNRNIVIDGTGMQPDFLWIKSRNDTDNHRLVDSVRGATKHLESDGNGAEQTSSNVKAFTSTGVTLSNNGSVNANSELYVGWSWKESATAGFDICSWTGNGSAQNISHNLSKVPTMIIVKNRTDDSSDWYCYNVHNGNTHSILLNTNGAKVGAYSDNWNNTTPTSSVFTVGSSNSTGGSSSDNMIAYVFTDIQGFSKFGTYIGNGSGPNGPFVYTGFKPAFVMFKRTNSTSAWSMQDSKRIPFNEGNKALFANTNAAESTSDNSMDFVSNGFRVRTDTSNYNTSNGTYIYMAFAENPFVTSSGVPATAR